MFKERGYSIINLLLSKRYVNDSVSTFTFHFVNAFFFSFLNPQNILMIHCSPSYFKYKLMLFFNLLATYGPRQCNRCKCYLLQRIGDGRKNSKSYGWLYLKVTKALSILKHCGCKLGCKVCMCRKFELPCIELWKCSGKCSPWSVFIWSIRSDNKHDIIFWYIVSYDKISVCWTLEVLGEF